MHQHEVLLGIRWFWAAVFFGFGVFFILRGGCFASVRKAYKGIRLGGRDGAEAAGSRIEQALSRREAAEGSPAGIGRWAGGASIALSAAAVFSAAPVGLLYALLCFVLAMTSAAIFLQLRNLQRTRVAVLSVRTTEQVIPPVWFALAVASALCALIVIGERAWAAPSALVCASTMLTALISWRLTQLGAILSGEDLQAEQIVDDRVRFYRSSTTLLLAFAQPFVFISQMYSDTGITHWAAYFATCLPFLAFLAWMVRRQHAHVELA